MSIEAQLIEVLDARLHDLSNKARNIDLILYFYGFRGDPWPTLEQTANHFGFTSRERARQIRGRIKKVVSAADLPSIDDFQQLLAQRKHWRYSELTEHVFDSAVAGDNFHLEGLFNLTQDVGAQTPYGIYSPELETQTRGHIDKFTERFVLHHGVVSHLKRLLKHAKKAPGWDGMARFGAIGENDAAFAEYRELLRELIMHAKDAWWRTVDGHEWFMFENRDNSLVNNCEKVFSTFRLCDLQRLATACERAFYKRTPKREYPPFEAVREYLSTSRRFEIAGQLISYRGEGGKGPTGVELDAVEFLKGRGQAAYQEFLQHLLNGGNSLPNARTAILHSPLVFVDESGGLGNYTYSLVHAEASEEGPDRRESFRQRLIDMDETDMPIEDKTRREQHILRELLFKGKEDETCALCGRQFPVAALVAAHKKKRADCSEIERVDPYIVMPLCAFGCDFLYERRYVRIRWGKVVPGNPLPDTDAIREYLERLRLIDRPLEDTWLQGSEEYFAYGW